VCEKRKNDYVKSIGFFEMTWRLLMNRTKQSWMTTAIMGFSTMASNLYLKERYNCIGFPQGFTKQNKHRL